MCAVEINQKKSDLDCRQDQSFARVGSRCFRAVRIEIKYATYERQSGSEKDQSGSGQPGPNLIRLTGSC